MVGCLILPRLAGGLGQEGDGIAKGLDRLGGIVGNLDRKFFLERHHQLDLVKRIRAKVVDEAGLLGDLIRIDIEVFHNDLADPISDIAHIRLPFLEIEVSFLLAPSQFIKRRVGSPNGNVCGLTSARKADRQE